MEARVVPTTNELARADVRAVEEGDVAVMASSEEGRADDA
jgi:hypothetical protein